MRPTDTAYASGCWRVLRGVTALLVASGVLASQPLLAAEAVRRPPLIDIEYLEGPGDPLRLQEKPAAVITIPGRSDVQVWLPRDAASGTVSVSGAIVRLSAGARAYLADMQPDALFVEVVAPAGESIDLTSLLRGARWTGAYAALLSAPTRRQATVAIMEAGGRIVFRSVNTDAGERLVASVDAIESGLVTGVGPLPANFAQGIDSKENTVVASVSPRDTAAVKPSLPGPPALVTADVVVTPLATEPARAPTSLQAPASTVPQPQLAGLAAQSDTKPPQSVGTADARPATVLPTERPAQPSTSMASDQPAAGSAKASVTTAAVAPVPRESLAPAERPGEQVATNQTSAVAATQVPVAGNTGAKAAEPGDSTKPAVRPQPPVAVTSVKAQEPKAAESAPASSAGTEVREARIEAKPQTKSDASERVPEVAKPSPDVMSSPSIAMSGSKGAASVARDDSVPSKPAPAVKADPIQRPASQGTTSPPQSTTAIAVTSVSVPSKTAVREEVPAPVVTVSKPVPAMVAEAAATSVAATGEPAGTTLASAPPATELRGRPTSTRQRSACTDCDIDRMLAQRMGAGVRSMSEITAVHPSLDALRMR